MAAKQKLRAVETDEADALETALGLAFREVTIRGEVVRVEEFEIAHLPAILKIVRNLSGLVMGDVTSDALLRSGEAGIELAMLATGRPRKWFTRLPLGDGLALYAAIIEANTSFFTHLPELTGLAQVVTGLLVPATSGQDSSASSPATDSPSAKSAD